MYRFSIHIDNKERTFNQENGATLFQLGELLTALSRCIESETAKCTLIKIKDGSYGTIIATEDLSCKDNFINTHRILEKTSFSSLTKEQRVYANVLDKLILSQDLTYVTYELDENDNEILVAEIISIQKPVEPKYYFLNTTIVGQMVGIDGVKENRPYIKIKPSKGGASFVVYINQEQEKQISEASLYKKKKVRFKVKIKKNFKNSDSEGVLISFKIPSYENFSKAVDSAREKFGDLFRDIKDSAASIKKLREDL